MSARHPLWPLFNDKFLFPLAGGGIDTSFVPEDPGVPVCPPVLRRSGMKPVTLWALDWMTSAAEVFFGFRPRFISGQRTRCEQFWLKRRFGDVRPVANPGTSMHEFGWAFDLAPQAFPDQPDYRRQLDKLELIGKFLGLRWGGRSDPAHWAMISRATWEGALIKGAPRAALRRQVHLPRNILDVVPRGGEGAIGIPAPIGDPNGGDGVSPTLPLPQQPTQE